MSALAGILGGVLAATFTTIILTSKGVARLKRFAIMYAIAGLAFVVIGLGVLKTLTAVAIAMMLFGATCLMFAQVYKTLCEFQRS